MNFSSTPLMHRRSSAPPIHQSTNISPSTGSNTNTNHEDSLRAMSISLADLSIGANSNAYANSSTGGYQEYVPGGHVVTNHQVQAPPVSAAPGSSTANQLGDLSMLGGGKGLSWGPSSKAESGIIRQQSTGSTISQPQQQQHQQQQQTHYTGNDYSKIEQKKREESMDVFLSRSPSQIIGSEFLKFRNDENTRTIPALSLDISNQHGKNAMGMISQQGSSFSDTTSNNNNVSIPNHSHSRQSSYSETAPRNGRDTSSPSCSVTGTSASSRSVSPSWNTTLPEGMRRSSMPSIPTGSVGGVGIGHTISHYQQQNNNNSATTTAINSTAIPTSSSSISNLAAARISTSLNSNASNNYREDLNSSYDTSLSSGHQIYPGNSNSYENFHAQQGSSGMNSSFSLSSVALDSVRDNNYHHGLNGSSSRHNLGSNGLDESHFSQQQQQQQVLSQGYNTIMNDNSVLKPQQPHSKEAKPQQQVFYMAVPTEDGQGQVLQPIQMQMVQIPGQPNAFVLPAASHTSNIVGVTAMPQGTPLTTIGGVGVGVGGFQSSQVHAERKNYSHMQGASAGRHQIDLTNGGQYMEEGFAPLYSDESQGYGDKHYRAVRGHGERRESVSNSTSDIVANLYASPQRPPLRELLGHVRRLSRDQVGCRLLQQALDEEGASAASMILKEGLSFWGEAMVDPFGNYLFQKILEKITAEERIVLVQNVSPRLVNASLNLHGTRSVQKVVELCAIDEKESSNNNNSSNNNIDGQKQETASEILTRSLTPAAARLCIDSHGNHVIQRILLKLPYQYSHFVFDAVANSVGDVARHRHGCCVIQRCLDSPPSTARSNLVHRIVEKSLELMQDAYGNYVVQYVLDVCSDEDVHAVCESVVGKVTLLAIQKFSSNVMEKCLERCTDKVRELYLAELSDSERIRELMMDPFGNYVIQRALAVSTHAQAVQLVEAMKPHLLSSTGGGIKNTAGGRRILAKISKRFPNFSLGDDFGDNGTLQKNGHKKNGNNNRHDNTIAGDQASARLNRRGQGRSDEFNDQQQKRLENSRNGRMEEKVAGQWDRA